MDNSNNSGHKSPVSNAKSTSSDGTSNKENQWRENHREHRRDHGKNRERGRDQWIRDKSFHGERDNSREEESQERFSEEQQPQLTPNQSTPYPTYNYPYHYQYPTVMSYNMMAAAAMNNPQWRVNGMDSVPTTQSNIPSTSTMATAMEMVQANGSNITPISFMGLPGEFSMIGMNNNGIAGQFCMVTGQENMTVSQIKEVIHFSKGVLLPPNPNAPPPSTQGRPMGCRTIFVGGLPEKITEDIIKEIFEKSGEIECVRLSTKKFCHIRFKEPESVERALYYSGYKLKIDNSDDPPNTGRLHVDYAVARDDAHDFECYTRRMNRVARHQEREISRSNTRPVSHYTEHEASLIAEKLRNEETFLHAADVLINWLDRGECSKRNAGTFYSMIQSTNSHVRRLITEKMKYEEQLNDAKEKLKKQKEGITHQFYEIEKVFKAACLQKVWDQFTKAQRINIELWKKQTEEIKNAHIEEIINERDDEEMELTEDENSDNTTQSVIDSQNQLEDKIAKLQEENDSLRCQLENANINESDARLVGLVSTFLHIHPFGASIDYICSFLQQINPSIQARDVESVMKRYPTVFREDSTGIGASLGKKWRFLGFEPQNNS